MPDYDPMKETKLPPRDLYLELRTIEDRGRRLSATRRFRMSALLVLIRAGWAAAKPGPAKRGV